MKIRLILGVLVLAITLDGCGQSLCLIQGKWKIAEGRIENFEMTNPYSTNRIEFKEDTVTLASGFFYNTQGLNESDVTGRFPFVYYGKQERFRVDKDSLFIYRAPYKEWIGFKVFCLKNHKIRLIGKSDTLLLEKDIPSKRKSVCKIRFVKLVLFSGPLDIYKVAYKVQYENNDRLKFQSLDSMNKEDSKIIDLKLRPGTFTRICEGFNMINLNEIKPKYATDESDSKSAEIEIGLEDGSIIKTFIQNIYYDYSEELRLALVPVLYGHQQYLDSHPPKKLDE